MAVFFSTLAATAGTVSITPVADNTLFQDAAGALSGGAMPNLYLGRTAGALARRPVMRFDVAGSVPSGATVTSAALRITVNLSVSAGDFTDLYRASNAWGEGSSFIGGAGGGGAASSNQDATWIHTFYNTSLWNSAGGDYAPVESASLSMSSAGTYTFSSAQLNADVQNWLDNPQANYGWLLRTRLEIAGNAMRFDSRESATASNRPTLIIGYDAPVFEHEAVSGKRVSNGFLCVWSTVSGQVYSADFITNLTVNPQIWTPLTVVTANNSTVSITDTNAPGRLGYYRLLKLEF